MAWNKTIILANKVLQTITIIEKGLIIVNISVVNIEKDWLAF